MTLQERIDHLEFCLREITGSEQPTVINGRALSRARARILNTLLNARGRAISNDALVVAMCWDRPESEWPAATVVSAQVCYLRRDLRDVGSDIEIQHVWRLGYRVPA